MPDWPNTSYLNSVTAITSDGVGRKSLHPSNQDRTPGDPGAPQAPRNLDSTQVVDKRPYLPRVWVPELGSPRRRLRKGHQVLRRRPSRDEATPVVYLEDTGSTGTTDTGTHTPNGDTYVYRVKAINPPGKGEWSNYVRIVRSDE